MSRKTTKRDRRQSSAMPDAPALHECAAQTRSLRAAVKAQAELLSDALRENERLHARVAELLRANNELVFARQDAVLALTQHRREMAAFGNDYAQFASRIVGLIAPVAAAADADVFEAAPASAMPASLGLADAYFGAGQ